MPRPRSLKPSYCLDKSSGRAFITLNGHREYLGKHGTQESRDKYDQLIGEWIVAGRTVTPTAPAAADGPTVSIVLNAFRKHAEAYYRRADGTPTSEVDNFKHAMRPLRRLYGASAATAFGPLALAATRDEMIRSGWCRTNINRMVNRIRHIFKWAASVELIPASIYQGLQAVPGLKAGRSEARESEPVKPVPEAHVQATLKYLSSTVKAMVQLQELTGARPGEICGMRTCDVETTGKVWIFTPESHKTQHHGHTRSIFIGPKAKKILAPMLKADMTAYIFSPVDADAERREKMHEQRKTAGGQGNAIGANRKASPRKKPGARYSVESYCHAVARACEKAFGMPDEYREPTTVAAIKAERELPAEEQVSRKEERRKLRLTWRTEHVWHPHQLRHNSGTRLRREFGVDAANTILGHATLSATAIYAEMDRDKAAKIVEQVG